MSLEFSDDKDFQHHLATSIADDVVADYESTVKNLIKTRKILQYCVSISSIIILVISFLSGILGIIDIYPLVTKFAAILTLGIGAEKDLKYLARQSMYPKLIVWQDS